MLKVQIQQHVDWAQLWVSPAASWESEHEDHHGTGVIWLTPTYFFAPVTCKKKKERKKAKVHSALL